MDARCLGHGAKVAMICWRCIGVANKPRFQHTSSAPEKRMMKREIIWQCNINEAYGCVIKYRDGHLEVRHTPAPMADAEQLIQDAAKDDGIATVLFVDKSEYERYEREAKRKVPVLKKLTKAMMNAEANSTGQKYHDAVVVTNDVVRAFLNKVPSNQGLANSTWQTVLRTIKWRAKPLQSISRIAVETHTTNLDNLIKELFKERWPDETRQET